MSDDFYDNLKNSAGEQLKLTSGSAYDRLTGLEAVYPFVEGRSVLDMGSYMGLICYEMGKHKPSLIHGFDIYERGVEFSRELFADIPIESRFERADFTKGAEVFETEFKGALLPQYDVVLFLAVYQHLRRQMSLKDIEAFMHYLISKTKEVLVLRTPLYHEIDQMIIRSGFSMVSFNDLSPEAAPVLVFVRNDSPRNPSFQLRQAMREYQAQNRGDA